VDNMLHSMLGEFLLVGSAVARLVEGAGMVRHSEMLLFYVAPRTGVVGRRDGSEI